MRWNEHRFRILALILACCASLSWLVTLVRADLVVDAGCLKQVPVDMSVGAGVETAEVDETTILQFQRAGITVPLTSNLSAEAGTITVRCRLPDEWPTEDRQTIIHIGEQAHVHVTLFANAGRMTAVYKGGEEHYAAISFRESADWQPGSWHDLVFSWKAEGEAVDFYLETDGRLVGRQVGHVIADWPDVGYVGARRQGQQWQGGIARVHLSRQFELPHELRPGRRTIVVDGDRSPGEMYNFWSISNYTSQHMFADPRYAARVKQEKPFMKYVNCVRLLGGRHDGLNAWFQGVAEDGHVQCDFTQMLVYLSEMQHCGYTPRIVLDNIPTAMSEPGELATYGNTRPARDLKVWHEYVRQAVEAMVEAFGAEVVSQWRFRVGTEPDLNPGHWQGTKDEYLQHYDCTVHAVCSVLPEAEIGPGNVLNPAHADHANAAGYKPWGLDIVDHCAVGKNTWTGETGTRMCFLQCSWYGAVGRPIDSLDVAIQRMRTRLAKYPQFADVPVSIAEFAILQDEYNRRLYSGDITEWGASWQAAVADRVYDLQVEQVHEWAQTTASILHPRAQVLAMLEQMQGGERLAVSVQSESAARAGALGCFKDGRYYILIYNHRPWRSPSIPEQVDLNLTAQRLRLADAWTATTWAIDREHGVFAHQFYADCDAAGLEPLPDSPIYGGNAALRFGPAMHQVLAQNHERYKQLSLPVAVDQDRALDIQDGQVRLSLAMPGHSVRLVVISPN